MHARINGVKNNTKRLQYHVKKTEQGQAKLIYAGNFLKNTEDLTIADIQQRFQRQIEKNTKVQTHTMHGFLSFSSLDELTPEEMSSIAQLYMERVGFGAQPYVVYQHMDAGHPHVHVLSILIRPDGTRMNLGKNIIYYSTMAKKEIEETYHLSPSRTWQEIEESSEDQPVLKVQYGKHPTTESITRVLVHVLPKYHYTSIAELNAVLSLYNVRAKVCESQGSGYSQKHAGLIYQALQDDGTPVGCVIAASRFHSKPTLSFLENKFQENIAKGLSSYRHMGNAVYFALQSEPSGWEDFIEKLRTEHVYAIPHKEKNGVVSRITFVDTKNKAAADSEHIKLGFSAQEILGKTGLDMHMNPLRTLTKKESDEEEITQKQVYSHRR